MEDHEMNVREALEVLERLDTLVNAEWERTRNTYPYDKPHAAAKVLLTQLLEREVNEVLK